MGRVLCFLRRHAWGPPKSDEAGPYRTCTRCHRVENSRRLGPGGYDGMPPTTHDTGGM